MLFDFAAVFYVTVAGSILCIGAELIVNIVYGHFFSTFTSMYDFDMKLQMRDHNILTAFLPIKLKNCLKDSYLLSIEKEI